MPETPVDEHCDPCGGENDIRPPGKPAIVDPEPQPTAMQLFPYEYLGACGGAGHPLHLSGYRRIERCGSTSAVQICHLLAEPLPWGIPTHLLFM